MSIKKFKGLLHGTSQNGAYVFVPFDVKKEYGTNGQVKIKATIDGEPYRGSIANMGEGHILIVLKSIRQKIGKQAGDIVAVTLEEDKEERTIELHPQFEKLLNENPKEKKFYNSLSFTNRKEYSKWIMDAKRDETRIQRLEKTLTKLKELKKNPSEK